MDKIYAYYYKFSQQRQTGFTLIELTLIFSVIAILSIIGLSISIDYNRAQVVNAAYEELKTTLLTAKSRALSQKKPPGCNDTLLSFEVVFNTTKNNYTLDAVCSISRKILKSIDLPKNVTFTAIPSSDKISFPILVGGSSGGTVILSGYNKSKTVEVDIDGNIK